MFNINSNQNIKMSRGDSVRFPLFINKGTLLEPIRYEFSDGVVSITTISDGLKATVVQETFKGKSSGAGTYTFTYNGTSWTLNSTVVNLIEYGIIVIGIPVATNTIVVTQTSNDGCEVYFYITQTNEPIEKALLRKVYKTSGVIETTIMRKPTTTETQQNINANKDMVIRLNPTDTDWMREGKYHYIIKAKVIDPETNGYVTQTITNRHEFWVIDDDYNRGLT